MVGDIAEAGSYLPEDLTDLWGKFSWMGLPLTYELERKTHPTFIPYESALDLTNGVSAFDAPLIYPSTPSFHNVVPDTVRTELLLRLGYGVPPPTQATVSGPSSLQMGETGYWSASVSPGPGNGYTHNWEYRIVCDVLDGPLAAGTNRKKPGDFTTFDVNCDQWNWGGVTAKFARDFSSAVTVDIRVQVSGGGGSVTSPSKRVYVGGGGGGPNLMASRSGSELAPDQSLASEAVQYTFALEQSRPHPVRSGATTAVRFTLPEASPVSLVLYDVLGREVQHLYAGEVEAGAHEVPSRRRIYLRGCTWFGWQQGAEAPRA